jgi:hypothetical protein
MRLLLVPMIVLAWSVAPAFGQDTIPRARVLQPAEIAPPEAVHVVPIPDELADGPTIDQADFDLPYLCCSDCIASPEVESPAELRLRLEREAFCRDDETAYPINVTPPAPGDRPPRPDGLQPTEIEVEKGRLTQPTLPD